ncbi:MAG: response regulator [Deltaproteobacteria bacterium]|nr:response regulator [Deltaproteobacteria bacterium]
MTCCGKKILVVEDNEQNMELFCDILEAKGYKVFKAVDGEAGVELAKKEKPDLIIMDMQLPQMDGFAAVKLIREDPIVKGVCIIAVTAHAMKGDEENFKKAGCSAYIPKPIVIKDFLTKVANCMAKG